MKIIRRKTNIIVRTLKKSVVRQAFAAETEIYCDLCGKTMITAQAAALLHNISTRLIYRLVEEGKIHFLETDAKIIFVCPDFSQMLLQDNY